MAASSFARISQNEFARRLHVVLVLSATVGVATGLAVAAFDEVVRDQMFAAVARRPVLLAGVVPLAGLVVAGLTIRRLAGGDAATTDAYVRSYHERAGTLSLRRLPAKLIACAATLGSGGALGYEGPAILTGASIGSFAERRFTSRWRQDDAKVLMVAGAAAGVAAVFKAPLTGIVFALEVPYTQDVARRALLPALVAAGTSYLTFVALLGTKPVLSVGGAAPFDIRDLLGGVALGVLCGMLARAGAWAISAAKGLTLRPVVRVPLAGGGLAGAAVAAHHWFGATLTLGSGYDAIEWAQAHPRSVGLLALLFLLRFGATWLTIAGGGVGGLFIPLVTQGAVLGALVQAIVHAKNPGLFPIVGIAAFLGGGYRTPLAGVAFVAEATGQPGFVVPALLAAAASQLAMGRWSFSPYQRAERRADTEALTRLALRDVMSADPDTVDAAMNLDECVHVMMASQRRWVPVVDGADYVGLLTLGDIAAVDRTRWNEVACGEVARRGLATADAGDSIETAAQLLRASGAGAVAVSEHGRIVGVVTLRDISNVERVLDRLAPEEGDAH